MSELPIRVNGFVWLTVAQYEELVSAAEELEDIREGARANDRG